MPRLPKFDEMYLYVQPSNLRARNWRTKIFERDIGRGLFTAAPIPPGHIIAYFCGEVIEREINDSLIAMDPERDGYQIAVSEDFVIDCYNNRNMCLASMANCYRGCWDFGRNKKASKNADIIGVNRRNKKTGVIERYAFLKSLEWIEAGGEVVTDYGNEFDRNPEELYHDISQAVVDRIIRRRFNIPHPNEIIDLTNDDE